MGNIIDIMFRPKVLKLFLLIDDSKKCYSSILAKKVDFTYSHAVKTIIKFVESDLVVMEKKGRMQMLRLTKKGKELQNYLAKAYDIMEGGENVGKE